ncbi:MAG: hypothetical protein OXC07_01465 [Kistimonas sp.]|nr:hypothetical protein [Kistimonas sp.]
MKLMRLRPAFFANVRNLRCAPATGSLAARHKLDLVNAVSAVANKGDWHEWRLWRDIQISPGPRVDSALMHTVARKAGESAGPSLQQAGTRGPELHRLPVLQPPQQRPKWGSQGDGQASIERENRDRASEYAKKSHRGTSSHSGVLLPPRPPAEELKSPRLVMEAMRLMASDGQSRRHKAQEQGMPSPLSATPGTGQQEQKLLPPPPLVGGLKSPRLVMEAMRWMESDGQSRRLKAQEQGMPSLLAATPGTGQQEQNLSLGKSSPLTQLPSMAALSADAGEPSGVTYGPRNRLQSKLYQLSEDIRMRDREDAASQTRSAIVAKAGTRESLSEPQRLVSRECGPRPQRLAERMPGPPVTARTGLNLKEKNTTLNEMSPSLKRPSLSAEDWSASTGEPSGVTYGPRNRLQSKLYQLSEDIRMRDEQNSTSAAGRAVVEREGRRPSITDPQQQVNRESRLLQQILDQGAPRFEKTRKTRTQGPEASSIGGEKTFAEPTQDSALPVKKKMEKVRPGNGPVRPGPHVADDLEGAGTDSHSARLAVLSGTRVRSDQPPSSPKRPLRRDWASMTPLLEKR